MKKEKIMLRQSEFKLARVHGKICTEKPSGEAELRNQIFLIGNLKIEYANNEFIPIRLMGYEIPLEESDLQNPQGPRVECIDLLGYDNECNPVIIELKAENTKEQLDEVIKQIKRYEEKFNLIKENIQNEFRKETFWSDFKFGSKTYKIILSGRNFFNDQKLPDKYETSGIMCCYFGGIQNYFDLDGKVSLLNQTVNKGFITLNIKNK